MKTRFAVAREDGFTLLARFLQGKEMIGSFAYVAARSAIFLPEQIKILAHVGLQEYWFSRCTLHESTADDQLEVPTQIEGSRYSYIAANSVSLSI
jgi:hypothetical protein